MLRGKLTLSQKNIADKNYIKTFFHTVYLVMWMQKTLFDFIKDDVDVAKIKQE
ncbi:MAG: hypothetical protein KGY50_03755 [Candidatus Thermoplasmatota archaeon]|nr:hypothetical protein [Candidatus Thermoplasmatota archaeon]